MTAQGAATDATSRPRPKQIIAAAATVGILAAAVFAFRGSVTWPQATVQDLSAAAEAQGGEDRPSSVVSAMFDAARAGDVETYLDCFSGEPREQIEAQLRQAVSAERFSAALRAPLARLNGYSFSSATEREPGVVELVAEQIFDGYTKSFHVEVTRAADGWKITALESTGRKANRYGQPAVAMPEEGR